MTNVNIYYLGTPRRIFAAKLDSRLITKTKVWELCAKKYVCPTITNKNTLVAPLTPEELERIKVQFPDVVQATVPTRAQSPMVQWLSDPDGMGATPTHQMETEDLDTKLWTAPEGGENALPIPLQLPGQVTGSDEEGMLAVERGAVCKNCHKAKCACHSPGSTVPPSTLAMRGPWSRTLSMMEEDLYPAEHLFVRMLKDNDNPNETPYTTTTSGYLLYKGSYGVLSSSVGQAPPGFVHNHGDQYIPYPIQGPHDSKIKQAQYVQTIMGPNPLVIGLRDDTDKVYSKPLYATPVYTFNGKPVYTIQELEVLKLTTED